MIFENYLIFPATKYPVGNWEPAGLHYEDAWFSSADGTRLHGWYFSHENARGTLLYCHGNGNYVARLGELGSHLSQRYRLNVLVWDYRGYGRSEGKPHEKGVLADARAARQWLARRADVSEQEILLMGRSLGGAVAVDLAASDATRGLILHSTFANMPDVAATHYPWLPVRYLIRTQFNSEVRIQGYLGPALQFHGDQDVVVPLEFGRRLHAAIPGQKRFVLLPGRGHNGALCDVFFAELGEFLDQVLE